MEKLLLTGAVFFICLAHGIRVFRWELFIQIYEKPHRRNLIQSLALGYLLNYILPYKLGDLFRAFMAGKKMKNGKALAFSTVIADRYLDLISIGCIFVVLSVYGVGNTDLIYHTAIFYIIISAVLLMLAFLIYFFKGTVKKTLRFAAGIFNEKIEASVLRLSWALIWNFKDIFQKIGKIKLMGVTATMWSCYLASYYMFSMYLTSFGEKTAWMDIFTMLFVQSGLTSSTNEAMSFLKNQAVIQHPVYVSLYMILPLVLILAFSLWYPKRIKEIDSEKSYLNLLPHLDSSERLAFLENYFSDKNREYAVHYLKINQDISIIRDYSAGSNATTMLCMDGENTFFRKYAFGKEGDKLYLQLCWIKENTGYIALPDILQQNKTDLHCYYDMPYNSNSVGLFEYVHTMPVIQGWEIIRRVLECLEGSIYKLQVRHAEPSLMHQYIETKVRKNIHTIKTAKLFRTLQQYETVLINGVEYKNLSCYDAYLKEETLQKVFMDDVYAVIHGDLTIENIICTRGCDGKDDFYIIDPNPGNIHDSPNLDYGKLLQSIHGGYEFLMSAKEVKTDHNRIDFLFTRSSAYTELHKYLRNYMEEHFGYEKTRSIYFHEIIHWLRLMPYKIEKDGKRAFLFYAGMLMVMNDVITMYGEDLLERNTTL